MWAVSSKVCWSLRVTLLFPIKNTGTPNRPRIKASLGAKYIPSAGMMEGVGTYTWVSNDVHFKGEFKGNALRGNGRYEWNADGVVYDGELWLFGIRVKACDSRLDMLLHCRRRCSRRVERGLRISSCY